MSEHVELLPNSPNGRTAPRGAGPRLIVDTPITAVITAMADDLRYLHRLEPNSGACHTLEHYFARLTDAIRDAMNANVWVSTEEAARLRECTTAAITSLCRNGSLVAQKRGGVWEVHKDSVLRDTRRN